MPDEVEVIDNTDAGDIVDDSEQDQEVVEPNSDEDEAEANTDSDESDDEAGEESDETDEQSEPDDGESGSDDKSQEKGESNKKLKRRIFKKSQENRELRERLQKLEADQQKVDVPELVEPNREEYDTVDEFIKAREGYVAEKTRRETSAEIEANRVKDTQEAEDNAIIESWSESKDDARERYEDFDDTLETSDVVVTGAMARFMMESDVGADVSYHISKNPELVDGFDKLSPIQQIRKMTRIEIDVESQLGKPNDKPVSKAPKPTKPVKAAKTGDKSEPKSKDSDADWFAKRNKQRHG